MSPLDTSLPAPREAFETNLLRFVNEVLPGLDRRQRAWSAVTADRPLFESGLLDSLSILHLLAHVERLTGEPVPDHLVLMKHFGTVRTIAATFWKSPTL
jgi:hypothetical protein